MCIHLSSFVKKELYTGKDDYCICLSWRAFLVTIFLQMCMETSLMNDSIYKQYIILQKP